MNTSLRRDIIQLSPSAAHLDDTFAILDSRGVQSRLAKAVGNENVCLVFKEYLKSKKTWTPLVNTAGVHLYNLSFTGARCVPEYCSAIYLLCINIGAV